MHALDDTNPVVEKRPRWKKCPICWDAIYLSDVRPVRWFHGQENPPPRGGEDIVLRLVIRPPVGTLALPRDEAEAYDDAQPVPAYLAAGVMDYARLMTGAEEYMAQQYDDEIEQMQARERDDELLYGDDPEWTRRAVLAVREARQRLEGMGHPPSRPSPSSRSTPTGPHPADEVLHLPASDPSQLVSTSPSVTPEPDRSTDAEPHRREPAYYFYQALPHYYLSSLDIRILKTAFGNYDSFPATLLPRVDHVSTGHVVDDDLRRRTKYLAHLPSGREVAFLECDWTDVVGPDVLQRFAPDIDRRRKKHREKEAREEKDRVRAEKWEDHQRWAATRRKRSNPSEVDDDRLHLDHVALPLHPPTTVTGALSTSELEGLSTSPPWPTANHRQQGSAFAALASPSTSPVTHRTVWGTPIVPPVPSPVGPAATAPAALESADDDDDGWLQGWEDDLLREVDVVAQACEQSNHHAEPATALPGTGTTTTTTTKKKKGKKITLMSTTVRRGA